MILQTWILAHMDEVIHEYLQYAGGHWRTFYQNGAIV